MRMTKSQLIEMIESEIVRARRASKRRLAEAPTLPLDDEDGLVAAKLAEAIDVLRSASDVVDESGRHDLFDKLERCIDLLGRTLNAVSRLER